MWKYRADEFLESNFFIPCELDAFDDLNARPFEKVVASPTLMVRSELDVLREIIKWSRKKSANYYYVEKLFNYLRVDQMQ